MLENSKNGSERPKHRKLDEQLTRGATGRGEVRQVSISGIRWEQSQDGIVEMKKGQAAR